jgi:hypothetical protein
MKGIQVDSNEGQNPHKSAKIGWGHLHIFFL